MKQKSSTISILVGALILVAIALVATRVSKKPIPPSGPENKTEIKNPSADYKLTQVDSKVLPQLMPAGIPFEKNTEILQNFEGVNDVTKQKQATRVFVTKKTLQENFDLYKKYLESQGWSIVNAYSAETIKTLSAKKDSAVMEIVIAVQGENNTVNVTYITPQ